MKTTLLFVVLQPLLLLTGCEAEGSRTATDPAAAQGQPAAGSLEVTYLANEGFMIAGGGRKVLIDAVFRDGVRGYAVLSQVTRERIEQARDAFADVDALFATHFHDDHFDPDAVSSHLAHNPHAFFFSTNQALDKLRANNRYDALRNRIVTTLPKEGERFHTGHRSLYVQLLNIHHGRKRPIENLGVLIEIAGKRILHIGDSEAEAAVFQKYDMTRDRVDIAFLPYWYFFEEDKKDAVRKYIQPRHIVLMHLPPDIDGYGGAGKHGGWQQVWAKIKAEFPGAVVFAKEMEARKFD